MQVYTPPGYSTEKKYPVLYLSYGIGGDETEWQRFARLNILLDNLLAEKKAAPVILVMPNSSAQKNQRGAPPRRLQRARHRTPAGFWRSC
jgi:enterochelin esterase-like enzyme